LKNVSKGCHGKHSLPRDVFTLNTILRRTVSQDNARPN
jgi:hypothetical protein